MCCISPATVAAQRGDYAKAVENYEASLAIRERLGDKANMGSLLSNLGIIAEYRGDYERALGFHERALALRTEIGDRRAIGNSATNLGNDRRRCSKRYAEARDWFQKSMVLNREVGDSWMVALCHHNLGNASRGLGDAKTARQHYAESLRAFRDYDDRWALAFLLEDIGILAALEGDAPSALLLLGAADAMREAIGSPRAPSYEEEIATQMARVSPRCPSASSETPGARPRARPGRRGRPCPFAMRAGAGRRRDRTLQVVDCLGAHDASNSGHMHTSCMRSS